MPYSVQQTRATFRYILRVVSISSKRSGSYASPIVSGRTSRALLRGTRTLRTTLKKVQLSDTDLWELLYSGCMLL